VKKTKTPRFSHTSNSPKGMGNYYGTGIRAPLGKMRDDSIGMVQVSGKKLKKPPRSLA